VAGFDQVVCDFTPLFVCNPFETDEMSYEEATRSLQLAAADPARRRRLIRMRQNAARPGDMPPETTDSRFAGVGNSNAR